jgi:hypothetical protein
MPNRTMNGSTKKPFGRCRQASSSFVLGAYLQPAAQRQAKRKAMTDAAKQKLLVLYLIPASVMADWAKTDPTTRQAEEQKMQAAWGKWMGPSAQFPFIRSNATTKIRLRWDTQVVSIRAAGVQVIQQK